MNKIIQKKKAMLIDLLELVDRLQNEIYELEKPKNHG